MADSLGIVSHQHPPEEFYAPAWDLDRLRTHLAAMHGLTPAVTDVQALAAIHAAEHPVQAGIARD